MSLFNHVRGSPTGTGRHDSGYVSTSTSLRVAAQFVQAILDRDGFIYAIRPTPNMIDVAGTLRQFYSHGQEREVASLGPSHYSQVAQWREVRGGAEGPTVRNSDCNSRIMLNGMCSHAW